MAFARSIKSPQRLMRMLTLRVDGATPALDEGGFDCTLTDNGVGDYTISFNKNYTRIPACVATPVTADTICQIDTPAVGSVGVKCFDATDGTTAKDAVFHLLVMGADTSDQI